MEALIIIAGILFAPLFIVYGLSKPTCSRTVDRVRIAEKLRKRGRPEEEVRKLTNLHRQKYGSV